MALTIKNLANQNAAPQRAEAAKPGPAKTRTTVKPWEVEPIEKGDGAEPQVLQAGEGVAAESALPAPNVEESPTSPAPSAEAVAQAEPSREPAMEMREVEKHGRQPPAPPVEETKRAEPAREPAPRAKPAAERAPKGYAADADDVERGLDQVLGDVEELKLQLRNAQKSKRALEEELTVAKAKIQETAARADERAHTIVHLQEELGELGAETQRQLAELCAADGERAEGARELKRFRVELKDTQGRASAREAEVATLRGALETLGKKAEAREQQVKQSNEEHTLRWRKFEDQLNQKDRELFQARATIDELRQEKALLETRLARLERWRAAFQKVRSTVEGARERTATETEPEV